MKIASGLVSLLLLIALCFAIGAGYGACKAGASVTYRLLGGAQ